MCSYSFLICLSRFLLSFSFSEGFLCFLFLTYMPGVIDFLEHITSPNRRLRVNELFTLNPYCNVHIIKIHAKVVQVVIFSLNRHLITFA